MLDDTAIAAAALQAARLLDPLIELPGAPWTGVRLLRFPGNVAELRCGVTLCTGAPCGPDPDATFHLLRKRGGPLGDRLHAACRDAALSAEALLAPAFPVGTHLGIEVRRHRSATWARYADRVVILDDARGPLDTPAEVQTAIEELADLLPDRATIPLSLCDDMSAHERMEHARRAERPAFRHLAFYALRDARASACAPMVTRHGRLAITHVGGADTPVRNPIHVARLPAPL